MSKQLTPRQVIAVLLRQGATILCFRCKEPITFAEDAQREHLHERALGGGEAIDNAAFSHSGCHAQVTDGNGATSAGSSKHRIAKTKPTRADKFGVKKPPVDQPRPEKPRFGFSRRAA